MFVGKLLCFLKWRLIEKSYGYEWELVTLWRRIKARWLGLEQDDIIWMKGHIQGHQPEISGETYSGVTCIKCGHYVAYSLDCDRIVCKNCGKLLYKKGTDE